MSEENENESSEAGEEKNSSSYEGTENSKFGKLVIAKSSGKNTAGQPVMTFVDEGPEDKGFASVASAMAEVKTLAEEEWEELASDPEADTEKIQLSTYYVLRVAKVVSPRPAVRVELDLGD